MSKVRYFSGNTELKGIHAVSNVRFQSIGGQKNKHNAYDSFKRMVGHPATGPDAVLPVTRKIIFKSNPSLHVCDARCLNATGHNCECSCGGANHGAGSH